MQEGVEGFLEELIVRRELSDNFCHYEPNYDNLQACSNWAIETLNAHRNDKREFIYTLCAALMYYRSHCHILRQCLGSGYLML